jgi:hypothetical protein
MFTPGTLAEQCATDPEGLGMNITECSTFIPSSEVNADMLAS